MMTRAVLGMMLAVAGGCALVEPYADYTGSSAMPRPLESSISLYRNGKPEPPIQNLGVVRVTCPWRASGGEVQGGCSYAQAMELARRHTLMAGGDGIYDIKPTPLAAAPGRYGAMDATVYRRTGPAPSKVVAPAPLPDEGDRPSVEERLRRLQKMRDDGLITPEDYDRRKADIVQEM